MSRVLFCSGVALLLAAGVPRAADKDAAGDEVAIGKVVSLDIKDDGAGTLTVLVKRKARVPLPPREMTFQVTKETRFAEAADAGEEGKTADARKASAWVKDSATVTVRYFSEGDKLTATTVSLVAAPAKPDKPADGPQPPATDEAKLHELLQARLEAARKAYKVRMAQYAAGALGLDQLEAAERRIFTAELELLDKKEDRVSACEKNLERCAAVKELAEAKSKAGLAGVADAADAEYDRLDAAILLEREKAK